MVLNYFLLSTLHLPKSSLSLFMFGVFADHANDPFSLYDLAFIADFFNGCPDFHFSLSGYLENYPHLA